MVRGIHEDRSLRLSVSREKIFNVGVGGILLGGVLLFSVDLPITNTCRLCATF